VGAEPVELGAVKLLSMLDCNLLQVKLPHLEVEVTSLELLRAVSPCLQLFGLDCLPLRLCKDGHGLQDDIDQLHVETLSKIKVERLSRNAAVLLENVSEVLRHLFLDEESKVRIHHSHEAEEETSAEHENIAYVLNIEGQVVRVACVIVGKELLVVVKELDGPDDQHHHYV